MLCSATKLSKIPLSNRIYWQQPRHQKTIPQEGILSATEFGLAAVHAVPIVIAGSLGGRGLATLVAIVMTLVAANIGGAQYTLIDLLAVAGALVYVFVARSNTSQEKMTNPQVSKPTPTQTAPVDHSTSDFIILIIVGIGVWVWISTSNDAGKSNPVTQPNRASMPGLQSVASLPSSGSQPALARPITTPVIQPDRSSASHTYAAQTDMRHCLKLNSNIQIARCAEGK